MIGEKFKAAGIQFGYHNHTEAFRITEGVVPYDELMRLTDPSKVTMEMDCGWVVVGGADPVEYLKKYPTRITMLHVKDFKMADAPAAAPAAVAPRHLLQRQPRPVRPPPRRAAAPESRNWVRVRSTTSRSSTRQRRLPCNPLLCGTGRLRHAANGLAEDRRRLFAKIRRVEFRNGKARWAGPGIFVARLFCSRLSAPSHLPDLLERFSYCYGRDEIGEEQLSLAESCVHGIFPGYS